MVDLTLLCSDRFRVLELLEEKEMFDGKEVYSKCSQDEMAELLELSKHSVNNLISELKELNFVENKTKGKYQITKHGYEALEALTKGKKMNKASNYKCASFFAGVGGIDLGFEKFGFETVYANEFDPKAAHTFESNFDLKVDVRDIHDVVENLYNMDDKINQKDFNIMLAGFPCQAFSIAGYREGFEDKKGRGGLFFELIKIIHEKKPEVVFLENVKNLVSHDDGKTFRIIKESLEAEGYFIKEKVLNSMDYGNVPQNRERIYIVAFRDKKKRDQFRFPFPTELTNKLSSVIDYKNQKDEKYYYTNKFLHFDELKKEITSQETVYQWRRVYVRANKNNVCPTLTANMGTGGHNVPLVLTDYGIRKLTPHECFALQGFPQDYKLPNDISMSYLYKQAGNSVSVSVINRIAEQILKVL